MLSFPGMQHSRLRPEPSGFEEPSTTRPMHVSMASGRSLDAERARQILAAGDFRMAVHIA